MGNISALAQATTAATALSNLILVSPRNTIGYQPQSQPNPLGSPQQPPPPLLFHYEGDQSARLKSDITDHYVEDNTARQDQIALHPPMVTTHGFIGELNNVPPAALAAVKAIADKLTGISAYSPGLSVTALEAYNTAAQLYAVGQNAANSAVAAWNTVNNAISGGSSGGESVITSQGTIVLQKNQTEQQVMFQQLFGYWSNRFLFTVQTPWAVFQNMAIDDIIAVQDATTQVITDFNVIFKQIRIASTQVAGTLDPTNLQNRAAYQASSVVNQGTNSPTPSIPFTSGLLAFPSV